MFLCPYCYEQVSGKIVQCPRCAQFFIDDLIQADFPRMDKKKCIFCGKGIIDQAKICKFCRRWLDEVDRAVEDIDPEDLV